jgi:ABC-2 type transport system permease protein
MGETTHTTRTAPRHAPETLANPAFSPRRVGAMVLRYWYLLRSSWPRIFSLAYWPVVQMLIWGFVQTFFMQHSGFFAQAAGVLIGAVLLWDVMFRGQLGLSLSFFEEIWSRNLGHLMVSPLRPAEFILALMTMSIIRTVIGVIPATLLAIWFFGFSVYELGIALIGFFVNLIVFGWAIGLMVSGLVLRYGQGAEELAWAVVFSIAPLAAIYYPVSVLPGWAQAISAALPASHVFEGMRSILIDGVYRADLMLNAASLNLLYILLGVAAYFFFLRQARRRGMLLQIGE